MNHTLSHLRAPRRHGGMVIGLLVALMLAGITGWLGYTYWFGSGSRVSPEELITAQVSRGPFDHIVLEQGEIESSANIEVVCEVESRGAGGTQILWVIDEGARVKEGDKLVELDSSQLETELKEDRLQVLAAESNVATAQAALEQAKIAKQEYIKGVYKTEEKRILSELAIAEQELTKAQLALQSSERLVAKGLLENLQLDADRFAVINARNQVESAEQQLDVLKNLTLKKMLVQYDSDIEAAAATLSAMKSELLEEQTEMEEREQQIEKCVMYAPADGVVVHANQYSRRGGNAEFVVEPGATVRERQAIIQLPDPTKMQIKCKVNESQITLIRPGMPAKISIDALPDLQLKGTVTKVNRYAEPGSWMTSSIKEYATTVQIVDPPEVIRTGMTAAVEIFVEQLPNAMQVPIQALYEYGGDMYTLVQTGPETFETRIIDVGATNDTMAAIDGGLEEGEVVVLNLRQHLNLLDLPELEPEDNTDLIEEGEVPPDEEVPAEEPRGFDGPSRGGPVGEGGPAAGGAGGGRPDPAQIAQRIFARNDSDGDGKISGEEISAADDRARQMLSSADSDGDGSVTRAEVRAALQQRMGGGGGGE